MDPLHVHVGRETPIHLHLTDNKRKLSAKAAKISKSFSEMSAGRPSLRAQESLNKPTRLTWNSPTHTLQIQTPSRVSIRTPETGTGPGLELSELGTGTGGKTTELILETPDVTRTKEQLTDAKNRIRELESEVELERTIRRVEQRDKLGGELSGLDLADTSFKMSKQDSNLIRQQAREGLDSVRQLQERREGILRKLLETELLSADSSKLSDKLRRIVQRVEREKSTNGSYGQGVSHELAEIRDELLKTLVEFDSCNAGLRRLLRDQQEGEGQVKVALSQQELLLSRLKKAENNFTNQLRENELLDSDLRSAKNTLKSADRQFETNSINTKRLESQLLESHKEVERLRESLLATERQEEDTLRSSRFREEDMRSKLSTSEAETSSLRATLKSQQTHADTVQQGREKLSRELRHKSEEISRLSEQLIEIQNKHSKVSRDKTQLEAEVGLYRDKVAELEATLFQSKDTAKTSLDSLSKRLLETTQELNACHIEKQRTEAKVSALKEKLSQLETMSDTRAQTANTEVAQLQGSIGHFETLILEYKSQLDELKRENLVLHSELATTDGNLERLRDDQRNSVELEKIKFQSKVAEMEPLPEMIRERDNKIHALREKVNSLEDFLSKQTITLSEFSEREKDHLTLGDTTRERLFHLSGENKVFQDRVAELERRVNDCSEQNRDLIAIAGKKEEALQRVQTRLEDVTNENINVSRQMETSRADTRRQVELMREKLSSRERAIQSNVADLEAQVAQLGATNSQLKRNKEDAERRYTNRIVEMKEKLEQADSSARSMQSYIQFLKISYASVFHDTAEKPITY